MLEVKQRRDVSWDDMASIEDPIAAKAEIESVFFQKDGLESIWGISDVIHGYTDGPASRDEGTLRQLQDALEWGRIFLLSSDPCYPIVRWQKNDTHPHGGYWAKTQYVHPDIGWTVDALLTAIEPIRVISGSGSGQANGEQQAGVDDTASGGEDDFEAAAGQQSTEVVAEEVISATNASVNTQESTDNENPIKIILLVPGTTDPVNTDDDKHGANSDYWIKNELLLKQLKSLEQSDSNIKLNYEYFSWSGDNSVEARGQNSTSTDANPVIDAGLRFKDFLYRFYSGWTKQSVHLHLIGHSHGGNVMNEFTQAIKDDFPAKWKIKSLTYLSTPFFNHLHPVDNTHFHQEAKMLLVHNKYDLTQQAIANYSVVNLEKAWKIKPRLEAFVDDVVKAFKAALNNIVSKKNLTLFFDFGTTAEKWQALGRELKQSADTLESQWSTLRNELVPVGDIIPSTLLALGDSVTLQYSAWADATERRLERQAQKFTDANVLEHIYQDYFNLRSFLEAMRPKVLVQIFINITGGNTDESRANSPLMTAIDDLVSGIIAVFDDTHRLPTPLPDNVPFKQIDVGAKDAYYRVANAAFSPFIKGVEKNQKQYQKAVEHNDLEQQKSLRQAFIFALLGQMDFSIIVKLHNWVDLAETATLGELNTEVGKLKDNLQWLMEQLQKSHYPLMVVDDLLLSYCLKYQLDKNSDDKTLSGFTKWVEDKVLVDQERLLEGLDTLALSDNATLTKLIDTIKRKNAPHSYEIDPKSGLLDEKTLRGSLAYFAITSHSVSRQKLYELSPNVKQAFISCL